MASVPLTFIPPIEPDIVRLHVWESDNPDTGFVEIDQTSVGTYPDYITRFVTNKAARVDDYFAIQWEDAAGALSELSESIKGGTTTLIGELVERVALRIPTIDENVIIQEAEAVVSYIYNIDDPYTIDINTVNRLWMTELTNLVLVASQYVDVVNKTSSSQDYTAGMVSERASSSTNIGMLDALDRVERRALRRLGLAGSRIASIADNPSILFGYEKDMLDSSRILSTRMAIAQSVVVEDLPTGTIISDR